MKQLLGFWKTAFDPTTIAGLKIWYDATNLTQAAGLVSAIADKSGNGTNATVTAGEEPTYSASNASFNNRPTWTCVAGGGTKVVRVPSSHGLTTTAKTVVIVGQCSNSGYAMGLPSGNTNIAGGGGAGDKWQASSDAFGTILVSSAGLANNPSVIVVVLNAGSSKLYVNSHTATTGGTGTIEDFTSQAIMVGNYGGPSSASGQDGPTTHFLIYNSALAQASVDYLLNGFGAQSGITISP